jgi:hypothetical protein
MEQASTDFAVITGRYLQSSTRLDNLESQMALIMAKLNRIERVFNQTSGAAAVVIVEPARE